VLSHPFDIRRGGRRMDGAREIVLALGSGVGFVLSHPFDKERRMDGTPIFVVSLGAHPTQAELGWGTRDCAGVREWGWVRGFPPIRQKTSNGWGTHFCGESRGPPHLSGAWMGHPGEIVLA
jgi:hypothetical protein